MAFDWSQYLNLAVELANTKDETHFRAAISRAYYAAFNVAKQFLEDTDGIPRDVPSIHEYVWDQFSHDPCSLGLTIYDQGDLLKEWRVRADYRARATISNGDVTLAIRRATAIINDVKQLS
jgi:uncharacterized protein (UPF0332 family)